MKDFILNSKFVNFVNAICCKSKIDNEVNLAILEIFKDLHIAYISLEIIHKSDRNSESIDVMSFGDTSYNAYPPDINMQNKMLNEGVFVYKIYKDKNLILWNENDIFNIEHLINLLTTYISKFRISAFANHMRSFDPLTNALNMYGFFQNALDILKSGNADKYSCIYINIKKFKVINKYFSFEGGNVALKQFAEGCIQFLGENQYFCRPGGDNFSAFVLNENVHTFFDFMTDFKLNLMRNGQPFEFKLSVCAGFAKMSNSDTHQHTAMEKANLAFLVSKIPTSPDLVEFNDSMREKALYEKELELMMIPALKNGEFVIHYQPKVDIESYQLVGAEALVRWHRDGKIIPPDEFIPIFEKNGFVCNIDFYVLEVVCKNLRYWLDNCINPVKISVNFSKLHLGYDDFVDRIIDTISKYNIPHKYFEVEFTETTSIDDYKKLNKAVSNLSDVGIYTSLDDFGTGYSSLNMLKDIPVDILKLDKDFMNNEDTTEREHIVITNIVRMAKELDINVISEGVENNNQLTFLKEISCDMVQGYLFDKPLPIEQFEERLVKGGYDIKFI